MASSLAPRSLSKEVLLIIFPIEPDHARIERIKARHPGLEVRWSKTTNPDGSYRDYSAHPPGTWEGVTMLCGSSKPPDPELVKDVTFVQLASAGADKWLGHPLYRRDDGGVVICTANGVHPPQIAEWVIGTWIAHQRHFAQYAEAQSRGVWDKRMDLVVRDSTACRMGILGYGAIGRQVARVASAMGMEIYAYTRSERSTPASRKDDSFVVPGTAGDPDGVLPSRWFHGASRQAIDEFLAQDLDILVISLPLTEETRGLLSAPQFEILSRHGKTFVSNIARGGHVDSEALLEALRAGKIRGAALDVTDPEPLPQDHPLWTAPNCFITPHISWKTHDYWGRGLDILETNLERLEKGEQPINMMNRELHY